MAPAEKDVDESPSLRLDLTATPNRHQWANCIRERLRSCQRFVMAHPLVVLTPLLVLGALLAAGIVGVLILSDAIQQQRQDDARNEAVARGIIIAERIQMALVPVHGLANMVLDTPGHWWPTIQQSFNATSKSMVKLLAGTGLGTQMVIAIAPAGIVWGSYPLAGNEASIYHDLLTDPRQRDQAMAAIRSQEQSLTGPYNIKQGYAAATVRLPVFVNGTIYGPNSTFGLPRSPIAPFNNTPANCPECYGELRFWGFCSSILNWDVIRVESKVDDIFSESGYSFRLTRPMQATESADFILAESPDMKNQSLDAPVQVIIPVLKNEWTLLLSRPGGWYPSWRTPMIVVVVIVSLVVSLLIGLVMGWNCVLMETTARLKDTAQHLQEEKERMDALLARQFDLIHCFADVKAPDEGSDSEMLGLKIDRLRNSLKTLRVTSAHNGDKIELHELLGSGNFGKVYRGTWRATTVAVKCIVLPSSMSRSTHAEKMALMETAISSSMHHPHLVQTYTYSIKPIKDTSSLSKNSDLLLAAPTESSAGSSIALARNGDSESLHWSEQEKDVHSFEIQLVLEYCDGGSLEEVLRVGGFHNEGGLNFGGILNTAADVAKGMLHLHMNEILHSDLKAGNVMFKTGGDDGRGVMAKVVDFGLSIQLDVSGNQTHVSKMFQGTLTHMAPEVLLAGKQSKAADVYSFGILLYELYTGKGPYIGIPTALLGHYVAREGRRPQFSGFVPQKYKDLAERCWQGNPDLRPSFTEILEQLQAMCVSHSNIRPILLPSKSTKTQLPRLMLSPCQAQALAEAQAAPSPKAGPPPPLFLAHIPSLDTPATPSPQDPQLSTAPGEAAEPVIMVVADLTQRSFKGAVLPFPLGAIPEHNERDSTMREAAEAPGGGAAGTANTAGAGPSHLGRADLI